MLLVETSHNPNKAGLFEGSLFLGMGGVTLTLSPLISQEKLVQY